MLDFLGITLESNGMQLLPSMSGFPGSLYICLCASQGGGCDPYFFVRNQRKQKLYDYKEQVKKVRKVAIVYGADNITGGICCFS